MIEYLRNQTETALRELLEAAGLQEGDILVVGCSSSEVAGKQIGTASSLETAESILEGILPILEERRIALAAQCCEHLNRALILERTTAIRLGLPQVNVLPQPKAGGSFAMAAYHRFREPVAVETIQAQAGMDIGNTLIGMHLAPVAVPVRLSANRIGEAALVCARTRPKFIGGERAVYDERLL